MWMELGHMMEMGGGQTDPRGINFLLKNQREKGVHISNRQIWTLHTGSLQNQIMVMPLQNTIGQTDRQTDGRKDNE